MVQLSLNFLCRPLQTLQYRVFGLYGLATPFGCSLLFRQRRILPTPQTTQLQRLGLVPLLVPLEHSCRFPDAGSSYRGKTKCVTGKGSATSMPRAPPPECLGHRNSAHVTEARLRCVHREGLQCPVVPERLGHRNTTLVTVARTTGVHRERLQCRVVLKRLRHRNSARDFTHDLLEILR